MPSHGPPSLGLGKGIASDDWSQLPWDILESISKKITAMADYFRYRAVCTSWRWASPPLPRHLPPQMPWLMLPYQPTPDSGDTGRWLFFDTRDSKVHKIDLPETLGKRCAGSSRGWLVLQRYQGISLFNPITRAQISLPPLFVCPQALAFPEGACSLDGQENVLLQRPYRSSCGRLPLQIVKAVLSSDPWTSSCCVVMAIVYGRFGSSLAFCRVGEESWTAIWHPVESPFYPVADITYGNGSFYSVNGDDASLIVYNVGPPWSARLVPSFRNGGHKCLVWGVPHEGELLMVTRSLPERCRNGGRENVSLFKLDPMHGKPKPRWVEANDIGESMLFLGGWLGRHCISGEFSGRGGNRIYFVDEIMNEGKSVIHYHLGLLDIKDGGTEQIAQGLGTSSTEWRSSPVWFQPNLCSS